MRPRSRPTARLTALLALAGYGALCRPARADDKADCLAAASQGQTLRDRHALVEAREQFKVCARITCPALVQTDCGAWLEAVERTLPSIVLSARDGAGRDLVDVTVLIDGQPFATKLDGQAVPMNPGFHTFRFDIAGGVSQTAQAVVREGDKAQEIAVTFPAPDSSPKVERAPPVTPPPAPALTEPVANRGSPLRPIAWALGGAGVIALSVGSGIALDAKSKDNSASHEGGSAEETASRNAVNEGNVGTIVFVAGAAVAAAGVVLWIAAPNASVTLGVNARGAVLGGVF